MFDERFASNQRNWPNDPQSTAWLAEGTYRLLVRHPGQLVAIKKFKESDEDEQVAVVAPRASG